MGIECCRSPPCKPRRVRRRRRRVHHEVGIELGYAGAIREIDAVEAALGISLPPDFRTSLRIHNGTECGDPSTVPLDYLFNTGDIHEMTRAWHAEEDQEFDDPSAMACLIDEGMIHVKGPVRPTSSLAGRAVVGTMNGDVNWFLDLDPPKGRTRAGAPPEYLKSVSQLVGVQGLRM
ncbi:SMI1/KNR4 family protein [Glycomyces rhizosphaerae]|uniref:SMI1/KNR4 family protein n=1 Tax=Glycomyces rhizosphaerae TaxID=2054422 RepID=A0ABV7Q252_9ACTN